MTHKVLTYQDLNISLQEVYEEMGYRDGSLPDDATITETDAIIAEVSAWLRPQFAFTVKYGTLKEDSLTFKSPSSNLQSQSLNFRLGTIIARQIRHTEAYAIFVATAGVEYEAFQQRLTKAGDMVRVFIANALGTVIAEKCADEMEVSLQESIEKLAWRHTNRFSPGYCGWLVSEQQTLFSLFEEAAPCGITLTDSSLMIPIKSVSGIVGVGKEVRKNDYSCGLCDFAQCYKRRKG